MLLGMLPAVQGHTQDADVRAVLVAPITVERAAPVTSVPIDLKVGKLFLNAAANGQTRAFIFDSGSPTVLTRAFADSLGLESVGRNVGTDANGNRVTMDVAVLDSLSIGDTTFHEVPVLVFDYSDLDMGSCFMDGGVVGSEIFPGSAWRIDLQRRTLSIAESVNALGGSEPVVQAKLYDLGYPHAPVIDYTLGDVSDKAMFDTGSAETVTLFRPIADNRSVRRSSSSVVSGRGFEGESAGGRGELVDLLRFTLSGFLLAGQSIGTVRATTRGAPPTLVGAGVLATHTATLDYPGGRFLLEARSEAAAIKPEAGFSVAYVDNAATVVQLFESSAAARAGVRLGDRVIELQGRSLAATAPDTKCDNAKWLAESFDPLRATEIVVEREGSSVRILIPAADPR